METGTFAVQGDGVAEEDARWLFQQLMVALDMVHRLGIVNRDVKVPRPSPGHRYCHFLLLLFSGAAASCEFCEPCTYSCAVHRYYIALRPSCVKSKRDCCGMLAAG